MVKIHTLDDLKRTRSTFELKALNYDKIADLRSLDDVKKKRTRSTFEPKALNYDKINDLKKKCKPQKEVFQVNLETLDTFENQIKSGFYFLFWMIPILLILLPIMGGLIFLIIYLIPIAIIHDSWKYFQRLLSRNSFPN